jgi:hypothetical protein
MCGTLLVKLSPLRLDVISPTNHAKHLLRVTLALYAATAAAFAAFAVAFLFLSTPTRVQVRVEDGPRCEPAGRRLSVPPVSAKAANARGEGVLARPARYEPASLDALETALAEGGVGRLLAERWLSADAGLQRNCTYVSEGYQLRFGDAARTHWFEIFVRYVFESGQVAPPELCDDAQLAANETARALLYSGFVEPFAPAMQDAVRRACAPFSCVVDAPRSRLDAAVLALSATQTAFVAFFLVARCYYYAKHPDERVREFEAIGLE